MAPAVRRPRLEPAAPLPSSEASAGEPNQVWTNLIVNAVDAMAGSGTLRVAAHAFEPFVTTEEVGKGTGLGLDVSRRIVVERHGGEITFDSRPGNTVVRVRLPLVGLAG